MLAENNKVISSKIQEALDKFREALLTHCADQVERMILFGSQATGEAAAESDIDTLVVVNWETERLPGGFYASLCGDPRWRRIVELAYDISLEHNVYISSLVMSEREFYSWSPLVNRIKKEGIELWHRNTS